MVGVRSWSVWGTTAEVLVTDPSRLDEACAIAEARVAAVGDACDRFREDSEVSRLRGRASHGVRVSPLLADLVQVALDAASETDGAVDPTLGGALRAAGYDRDLRLLNDDGRPAGRTVGGIGGWRRLRLEDDRVFVPDDVELDLGAIAKARTADVAASVIASVARCGVLVNLGGDLATRGPAPEGGWQVTVQDLDGDPASRLSVPAGCGLATSSTQRRVWRRAGRPMHHILDPRTGRPALPVWRTASVVAHSTVTANTLSTSAIVDGSRAVARLTRAGYPARLVDAGGGVTLLGGWPPAEPAHATAA